MTNTTLNKIPRYQTAIIEKIIDSPWSVRLTEMGFLPGSITSVIRKSPFGSTLYVKLNSGHIALRKKEAEQIIISLVE